MKSLINLPSELVVNRVNSSKVAALITVITLSVMLILTTRIAHFDNSSVIPPIIILATFASVISAIIIALSLKRKVYAKTHSPLESLSFEFADSKSDAIMSAAAGNLWNKIPDMTRKSNGTAMKLELVYSKDNSFAAYQLFSYVPHTYEACSQIFYVDKEAVARINFSKLCTK